MEETKRYREKVLQEWRVKEYLDKMAEKHAQLKELLEDEDQNLKNELVQLNEDAISVETFTKFYEEIKDMKERSERSDRMRGEEEHEAQWMKGPEGRNASLQACLAAFTTAESLGRYLDLSSIHMQFNSLPGISSEEKHQVDYVSFLLSLYLDHSLPVPAHPTRKSPEYLSLLREINAYLSSFISRSKPLFDLDSLLTQARTQFDSQWQSETYTPSSSKSTNNVNSHSAMEVDVVVDRDWLLPWQLSHLSSGASEVPSDLYCVSCNMTMAKDTVWRSHISSKKHLKALEKYRDHVSQVSWEEEKLRQMLDTLNEVIEATKDAVEKKQARRPDEAAYVGQHGEEGDSDVDSEDSDDEDNWKKRRRMTKKNYPIGPDGNPIPFWLYRLQGLSHEFRCQICGNQPYFGRRAFERHFADSRHSYGLKCLGIENSRDFYEITDINKAIALHKHLTQSKNTGKWNPETMEEFEDEDGTVLDKATHDLLARQLGYEM